MTLPSTRWQCPPQKMLVPVVTFTEVNAFVVGFQVRAVAPRSCPDDARTSPVGNRWMCTATSGQLTGADHCPTSAGVGADTTTGTDALVVVLPAKSRATAVNVWLPFVVVDVSHATE